ncbi:class I SAM-dependent methyltransferase [Granulosicoccus antarcticus]|nr:class I SAM-dependent methyltransferase [Granulosicoccus antarcticus]
MNSKVVSGTEGYAEEAAILLDRYERNSFEDVYAAVRSYFPEVSSTIVDIGSGTGRDAAYLAQIGHQVVAVEPTAELREPAKELHPSENIEWIDDSLPELSQLLSLQSTFDVVILNAVWMHLDKGQREIAMESISKLTHVGSKLFISLRHGPIPNYRRMFDVSCNETIQLASKYSIELLFQTQGESVAEPYLVETGTTADLTFLQSYSESECAVNTTYEFTLPFCNCRISAQIDSYTPGAYSDYHRSQQSYYNEKNTKLNQL